jgi:TetR/AcrR family transcriptional regulator, transcriptional repressor for nem operon
MVNTDWSVMWESAMKKTQVKIMDAAEALFREQGFQGASLNDITKKAKLSKGAFFHYYKDKGSIANDVLKKYVREQLLAPLDEQAVRAQPVKVVLMGWIGETYQRVGDAQFKGGCLLGNWALEMSEHDETMRSEIAQYFIELENRLVDLLRPSAAQGKMMMEPRQFARLFIAAFEGVMMTVKVHKDKNRAAREFQALAELTEWMIKD